MLKQDYYFLKQNCYFTSKVIHVHTAYIQKTTLLKTHIKGDTADVKLGLLQVVEADGDKVVGEVQETQVHQNQVFT